MSRVVGWAAVLGLAPAVLWGPAWAQQLDLSHGGPVDISARGNARAVRNNVTVTADRLIAWYRKKGGAGTPTPAPAATAGLTGDPSTEGNEIYRLQAEGNVHIATATDQAQGDRATYDMDQSVMVMTGRNLKLTTPNNVITARDDLEYWPQKHMAVARGDAVVVTSDAKRISADTLVAYTTENPPPRATPVAAKGASDAMASSGKLERVEAFGHVSVRTPTDTVTGDRGVYVIENGMARLGGNVHITRGQNQLNGAEANVNMKTGIATLVAASQNRVHGLVLPNDASNKALGADPLAASPSDSKSGSQAGSASASRSSANASPNGGKKP